VGAPQYFPHLGTTPASTAVPGVAAFPGTQVASEVELFFDMYGNSSAGGIFGFGIGLYVAEYDRSGADFSKQDPVLPADAGRDNWIELWMKAVYIPLQTALTSAVAIRHQFRKKLNITLGDGEQLMFVVSNHANSSTSFGFTFWGRVKESRVY